jgi:hypothetical protein
MHQDSTDGVVSRSAGFILSAIGLAGESHLFWHFALVRELRRVLKDEQRA